MTRNGKIARLPRTIRDELNQRLLNGEQGKDLVLWLNGLPQVQAVLKTAFEGRPVTEDNVSEWKIGGYASWHDGERMRDEILSFMDSTNLLKAAAKGQLTDRMSLMLAATMAAQMRRLEAMPDSPEKAKIWRELRIGLLALRRSELYAERLKIEHVKHPKPGKPKKKRDANLTPRESILHRLGIGDGYDGSKNPELIRSRTPLNRSGSESIGPNRSESEC